MSDMLDEVDEQDHPTGRVVPRSMVDVVGSDIIHRCIAVFVFDRAGRLYVQTHKKGNVLDHSVGGHVDAGETYAVAAKREAEEELGVCDVPLTELGTGVRSREDGREHMFGVYECTPGPEWRFTPNDEVEEITPMAVEQIVAHMNEDPSRFTGGFINTLKFYIKIKGLHHQIVVDAKRR